MAKVRAIITVEFEYDTDAEDPAALDQKAYDDGETDIGDIVDWSENVTVKFENVED